MKKLILFVLFVVLLLLPLTSFSPNVSNIINSKINRLNELKLTDFSYYNYLEYLDLVQIPYKNIIIKQSILETGYFTSIVFTVNNNLFGMRHPIIRSTVSLGSNLKHAKYKHWTDSIDDYILWQEYHFHLINGCYYSFLTRVGYAEDKYYIKKLKQLI